MEKDEPPATTCNREMAPPASTHDSSDLSSPFRRLFMGERRRRRRRRRKRTDVDGREGGREGGDEDWLRKECHCRCRGNWKTCLPLIWLLYHVYYYSLLHALL